MDARKSAIFAFQFVKPILQTITHLLEDTVLQIQFWSVKCTIVIVPYAIISSASIPCYQPMQAIVIIRLAIYMKANHFKMPLKVLSTTYTYSNCIVYRLF